MKDNPVIKRLLSVNCPLVALWFPWYWRQSEMVALRVHAGRWSWYTQRGIIGKLVLLVKTLIWPLVAVVGLITAWLVHSGEVLRLTVRGRLSQFLDLMYLTFWWGFPPQEYYARRLYLNRLKDILKDYLSSNEVALLNMAMNSGKDAERINNKLRFDGLCHELGLPVIPVICIYEGGQAQEVGEDFSLPEMSFYFKPVNGLCGQGIERWDFDAESSHWKFKEQELDEAELKSHFEEKSKGATFILQEAAVNHPELAPFSTGGLITFRVLTVVGEDSEIEIISTTMVMPYGKAVANHGSYGGILASLDLKTATLGVAYKRLPVLMRHTHHPETGALIEGVNVSAWAELESLAIRAHKCFPDIFTIGWDLAMTPHGAVIVEGNTQWGASINFFPGRNGYRRYEEFYAQA